MNYNKKVIFFILRVNDELQVGTQILTSNVYKKKLRVGRLDFLDFSKYKQFIMRNHLLHFSTLIIKLNTLYIFYNKKVL